MTLLLRSSGPVLTLREILVLCRSCLVSELSQFNGEIAIHFPGLQGLNKPIVWVWPKVFVCLKCGVAEFQIPEEELQVLRRGGAAAAGSPS